MDVLKVINADFLSDSEKIHLFKAKNIKLDESLVSKVFSSDLDLDSQLELIKNIKLYQSKKDGVTEASRPSKTFKSKSKEEIDDELESYASRPITQDEFDLLINTIKVGYIYYDDSNKKHIRRPNLQVALILSVEATIGFRINDVLRLKLSNIRGNKISFIEQKTKKLQYRQVNIALIEALQNYAHNNNIGYNEYLFKLKRRNVLHMLSAAANYLGLESIGTHSFRKFFAISAYKNSNNNIELVRKLLNHSSVAITQRYINVDQEQIDEYSSSINFMHNI